MHRARRRHAVDHPHRQLQRAPSLLCVQLSAMEGAYLDATIPAPPPPTAPRLPGQFHSSTSCPTPTGADVVVWGGGKLSLVNICRSEGDDRREMSARTATEPDDSLTSRRSRPAVRPDGTQAMDCSGICLSRVRPPGVQASLANGVARLSAVA